MGRPASVIFRRGTGHAAAAAWVTPDRRAG